MPFRTFWEARTGECVDDPVDMLEALRGEVLSEEEIDGTRKFHALASALCPTGREREVALVIVEVFDGFFSALNRICEAVGPDSGTQ